MALHKVRAAIAAGLSGEAFENAVRYAVAEADHAATPPVIHLDMDGVLVDCIGAVMGLFGVQASDPWRLVTSWEGASVALTKLLGKTVTEDEVWLRVADAGAPFWAGLEWTPWGRDILDECARHGEVVIVTTPLGIRGATQAPSVAGKLTWIAREIPEYNRRVVMAPGKGLLAHRGSVLVDDGPHNVKLAAEQGAETVLWPAPWNTVGYHDGMIQGALGAIGRAAARAKDHR